MPIVMYLLSFRRKETHVADDSNGQLFAAKFDSCTRSPSAKMQVWSTILALQVIVTWHGCRLRQQPTSLYVARHHTTPRQQLHHSQQASHLVGLLGYDHSEGHIPDDRHQHTMKDYKTMVRSAYTLPYTATSSMRTAAPARPG